MADRSIEEYTDEELEAMAASVEPELSSYSDAELEAMAAEGTPVVEEPAPVAEEPAATGQAPDWRSAFNQPTAEASLSQEDWERSGAGAAGAVEGISMGFSDEVYGVVRALADEIGGPEGHSFLAAYTTRRDEARDALKAAKDKNPTAALLGEVGGALGTALFTGGAGFIAKGATLPAMAIRSAGVGGLAGGISGAGASTDGSLGGVVVDAGVGAGMGAALGAAAPVVGEKIIKPVAAPLARWANQKALIQKLRSLGASPAKVRQLAGGLDEASGIVDAAERLGLVKSGVLAGTRTETAVQSKLKTLGDQFEVLRDMASADEAAIPYAKTQVNKMLKTKIEELGRAPELNKSELEYITRIKKDIENMVTAESHVITSDAIVNAKQFLDDVIYKTNRAASTIEDSTKLSVLREIRSALRDDEVKIIGGYLNEYHNALSFGRSYAPNELKTLQELQAEFGKIPLNEVKRGSSPTDAELLGDFKATYRGILSAYRATKVLDDWTKAASTADLSRSGMEQLSRTLTSIVLSGTGLGVGVIGGPAGALTGLASGYVAGKVAPKLGHKSAQMTAKLLNGLTVNPELGTQQRLLATLFNFAGPRVTFQVANDLIENDPEVREVLGLRAKKKNLLTE